jgi:radical SAM protein with 4Fe4S-binding SPASM domain
MFRSVELEVNSMCNRKCSYCPNVSAQRPTGYMTETLFQKIISDLADVNFDGNVAFHFYGEPLLDKRLLSFVEYTVRHVPGCRPLIYSNGDFLTLDLFREYIKWGRTKFLITQHDNRLPPNLQAIMTEASAEERDHIAIRFANDIEMMNRSGLIKTMSVPGEPLGVPCDAPLATMVITMNGNVVLCCNDYLETEVIGNVATYSLREIWCSEPFERFRNALSKGDRTASKLCVSCDSVPSESTLRRIVAQ